MSETALGLGPADRGHYLHNGVPARYHASFGIRRAAALKEVRFDEQIADRCRQAAAGPPVNAYPAIQIEGVF